MNIEESERSFVPPDHPRAKSLHYRELLVEALNKGVLAKNGLIAHGRGEAFDYILGEKTEDFAIDAMKTAVAMILLAKHPIISVNGNVAALVPDDIIKLSEKTGAKLEINLFYRTRDREIAIEKHLREHGAKEILGTIDRPRTTINEISHKRRIVDVEGINIADVVLVPLEDGDRTEALVKLGKKVITIDLNPLSRTAQAAHVTIVDNIVRAIPKMCEIVDMLKEKNERELKKIINSYNNKQIISRALLHMKNRLEKLSMMH